MEALDCSVAEKTEQRLVARGFDEFEIIRFDSKLLDRDCPFPDREKSVVYKISSDTGFPRALSICVKDVSQKRYIRVLLRNVTEGAQSFGMGTAAYISLGRVGFKEHQPLAEAQGDVSCQLLAPAQTGLPGDCVRITASAETYWRSADVRVKFVVVLRL